MGLHRRTRRWAVSAAALAMCLISTVPRAQAVDWCEPLLSPNPQPCPDPTDCCAIWGICGKGQQYCKRSHCASGACWGSDQAPQGSPPPPPAPPPPSPSPSPPRPPSPPPPSPRPPRSSPPPPKSAPPPPSPPVAIVPAPAPPSVRMSPPPPPPLPPTRPGTYTFVPLTEDQMRRMYQLTSIFENADTELQYGYADRLGDGRGVTFGFCGFTTGWADGLMVVEEYTRLKPGNPLAVYLDALRKVANRGDRFTGLDKPRREFIQAQWAVCNKEYHEPAMQWCRRVGCSLALTKAQFHDALVNHGEGLGNRGSVDYIFMAANKRMGGTMLNGVDEVEYLKAFLAARRDMLWKYDRTWRESVTRVDIYRKLVDIGNLNLDGPIYFDMKKRNTTEAGRAVWQVLDVYYGQFIVYENPQPDRKLEMAL